MNPPTALLHACVDAAAEAVRAAQAIAADPACAPRSAAAPLAAAWHALARTTASWLPPESADPEAWLPPGLAAQLTPREREAQRRELPALLAEARRPPELAGDFGLTRAQLLAHAARLDRMLAGLRRQLGARPARASRWPRRLAALAGLLVLAVLVARPWQSASFGPWRGAYHSLPDLRGDVTIRHDLDLRFDWGRAPPMDVIPADRYSVRWDTCLTLDAPRTVPFQLTSDNRARLFIDDKLVLQTQGKQLQARGAAIKLTAGVHPVRVEYTKVGRESHIGLTASLDGEPPQALPFSRLSAPRSAIDEPVVCD